MNEKLNTFCSVRGRRDSSAAAGTEGAADKEDTDAALDGSFEYHAGRPLECDAVLVDEASMLDLPLAAALLDALPRHRRVQLVLVGASSSLSPPPSPTPAFAS